MIKTTRVCILLVATLGTLLAGCRSSHYNGDRYTAWKQDILGPYDARLHALARREPPEGTSIEPSERVDSEFDAWWHRDLKQPLFATTTPLRLGLQSMWQAALTNSYQIQVFSDVPLSRETAMARADLRFAPHLFAEYRIEDIEEPVGSTLKTGGPDTFEEDSQVAEIGLRKKFITGGTVSLSQRFVELDNNSTYFLPPEQGQSRMVLNVTQPLLNGAGLGYNRSQHILAELDHQIGLDEFRRQVESHLLEIARSYWALYLSRARLVIRKRLVVEAKSIVSEIEGRGQLDALQSEILRARAELSTRESHALRAELAIRNAQSRLRSLINDPLLYMPMSTEIVPTTQPRAVGEMPDMREAMTDAIRNRPEIDQILRQIRAAEVRVDMAKNQLLPVLDLIVEARANGLEGDYDTSGAFQEQNDYMSYTIGAVLDVPLWRGSEKAEHQRRLIEQRQLQNQLRTTVEALLVEVEVSVREARTAYRELISGRERIKAATSELKSLAGRRSLITEGGVDATVYLERLLAAQQRLADAEGAYLQGLVTYNLSLVNLSRARGHLFTEKNIRIERREANGIPQLILMHE